MPCKDAIKKKLGQTGESLVVDMLESLGWKILERNWRAGRYAEVDVIARDGELLVFVEVKTRKMPFDDYDPDLGFGAVNWRKRRKIVNAARIYLSDRIRTSEGSCRFDVVVVCCDRQMTTRLFHVKNAFDG